VTIHSDASLYAALIDGAEQATLPLQTGRRAYVHVARGALTVNGEALTAGDAAMIVDAATVTLEQGRDAEVLVFDLGSLNG
jgi:redox-sensitive bicupin YhaK (pirin superfamily)